MELKNYIIPLRKWWWLVVAAVLVAAGSSYLATRNEPLIYQARASMVVGRSIENPNPTGNDIYLIQQLASTYADIAKREPVRAATMKALGLNRLPEYNVRVVPDTQLMEISVVDTDPERTKAVANELASQLILQTPAGASGPDTQRQAFINSQLDDLEAKIQDTQDEVRKKQADLAGLFGARQIADTQNQIAALQNKLGTLQANYAALLSNTQKGSLNAIRVIEPAALPTVPIGPNVRQTILLAAAIALVLAAGAAYLLEYLDDTLKNPDDVKKALHLATLGAIPVMQRKKAASGRPAIPGNDPAMAEGFRVLRTNLQFMGVDRPIRFLMITSTVPLEGKSTTAGNLAASLAQAGRRVILVDADLHRPLLHRLFNLPNNDGVTSALLQEKPDVETLLQASTVPGLQVLTSGPVPPNAAELLASSRIRELLAELGGRADIVVIDSPPVTVLADAVILSTQVDAVLLVVDARRTRRENAKRALQALAQVQARVVGVVLNRLPTQGAGYYYYHQYNRQYGSQNGHDARPEDDKQQTAKRGRARTEYKTP